MPATEPPPTVGALRRVLVESVPAPSLPSDFVLLEALPLTANGKIDHAALPAPDGSRPHLEVPYVPPRDHLEAELVALWEDVLGVYPVGVRDDFLELGGDSLRAAELLAGMGERWETELSFSLLAASGTVERLARALVGHRGDEPEPPVVHVREGRRPPLAFAHGDFVAGGLFCPGLARAVDPDRAFLAVTPHGLDGRPVPWTVEEMAEGRVSALRRVQPFGPYFLAGHCQLGGLVAYEMARLLVAAGEQVAALVLIESTPPNVTGRLAPAVRRLRSACCAAAKTAGLGPEAGQIAFLRLRRAGLAAGTIVRRGRLPTTQPPYWRRSTLLEALATATHAYVPGPFSGRMTLIWPEEDAFCSPAAAADRWRRIVREVDVRVVPGNHLTCVGRHVDALAAVLRAALEQAGQETRSSR